MLSKSLGLRHQRGQKEKLFLKVSNDPDYHAINFIFVLTGNVWCGQASSNGEPVFERIVKRWYRRRVVSFGVEDAKETYE
jgi:hypothetical protein